MTTPLQFPTQAAALKSAADVMLKGKRAKEELTWLQFDTSTFPPELAQLYTSLREAMRLTAEHRQAFEDAACGPIGSLMKIRPGQDVRFGYKFGQLSVALSDKQSSKPSNALRFGG